MSLRKLRIAWSVVWGIFCLLLIALWVVALALNPYDKRISLCKDFHVGVISRGLDARLAFFNDAEYGPYQGSIIGLEGGPPYIQRGFGDTLGIYYRYFRWPDNSILWTLSMSLWYPTLLFGVSSAMYLIHRTQLVRFQRRFSLRTLLIATTLFALLLGLVVYASR